MSVEHISSELLKKERLYDKEWIGENMYLFDPLARDGFRVQGRGAIAVNVAELIQRKYADEGHPFKYVRREEMDWLEPGNYCLGTSARPAATADCSIFPDALCFCA